MHVLRQLSAAGDTVLAEWEVENPEEVARAKMAVEELLAQGQAVFAVKEGVQGQAIKAFDPAIEELIAVAPLVGG